MQILSLKSMQYSLHTHGTVNKRDPVCGFRSSGIWSRVNE